MSILPLTIVYFRPLLRGSGEVSDGGRLRSSGRVKRSEYWRCYGSVRVSGMGRKGGRTKEKVRKPLKSLIDPGGHRELV